MRLGCEATASVLAYQLAGDAGLKVLHAQGKTEERETAPVENTLTESLELPAKEGSAVVVLMDEVLMYAKEKVIQDRDWRDRLLDFFQYLTQVATKVPRGCIVTSLLATDPRKTGDELGRQLLGDFYDIFRCEKEEGVEPIVDLPLQYRQNLTNPYNQNQRTISPKISD